MPAWTWAITFSAGLISGSARSLGYNYMREVVSAQGCGQIATNPFICGVFPVPGTVKVITQDNNWNSLRVGLVGDVDITERLKLSLDAAWLPLVMLDGTDAHWLRISTFPGDFSGPVPEDGTGWGYQLEGVLSYRVTDAISVGIGGPLLAYADQWEYPFRGPCERRPGIPATGRLEERQLRHVSSDRP